MSHEYLVDLVDHIDVLPHTIVSDVQSADPEAVLLDRQPMDKDETQVSDSSANGCWIPISNVFVGPVLHANPLICAALSYISFVF
jgi:hypothetical protein